MTLTYEGMKQEKVEAKRKAEERAAKIDAGLPILRAKLSANPIKLAEALSILGLDSEHGDDQVNLGMVLKLLYPHVTILFDSQGYVTNSRIALGWRYVLEKA